MYLPLADHAFTQSRPFDEEPALREECGVFGIWGHQDAATLSVLGLHALQHRGQEGAGIVTCAEDGHFNQHMAFGKIGDNFNSKEVVEALLGRAAIGHNRYSTSGMKRTLANIQPIFAEVCHGSVAIAHNGNLTNALTLRKELVSQGSIFRTSMDSEVIVHLLATSRTDSILDALIEALRQVEGAWSLVALHKEGLIGARDPMGIRPLVMGILDGHYVLASETCALDIIGAAYVREIEPGELVVISDNHLQTFRPFREDKKRFCIFEHVYFSRPDSKINNQNVYDLRKEMGRQLALEMPVEADVIVPVPDSGMAAALGYSESAGVPFELGIIRNHYVGRTFIEPTDTIRHLGVKLKHNANRAVIGGKRVVLVDDSIVRGTTSQKIVSMVREAGATEVHMRISSPPTIDPCFYGVDTPSKEKLLASKMSVEEMAEHIGVDSLAFLSTDGLYRSVGETAGRDPNVTKYCDACFTGDYPIEIRDHTLNVLPLLENTANG